MKIRPVEAGRKDGRTDRYDEAKIVAFRNLANAPEAWNEVVKKVKHSRYRPGVAQRDKVPTYHNNGTRWW